MQSNERQARIGRRTRIRAILAAVGGNADGWREINDSDVLWEKDRTE